MKIAGRPIDRANKPYVIAECSGNHNGELRQAIELIKAAKWSGAEAVKFQCYDADSMTLDCSKVDFIIQDGLWKGRRLYELYSKAQTPHKWMPILSAAAKDEGITFFASVFDKMGVDILASLDVPAFKIASFEAGDTPLIEYVAQTGKPIIISTGLASDEDVIDANAASGGNAAFLHCTSEYPGKIEHAGLGRISMLNVLLHMRNIIGLSDHTPSPTIIPIAATSMRVPIIEKHIKLEGDNDCEDAAFSLDPKSFKSMTEMVSTIYHGMSWDGPKDKTSTQFRRSIYAVADIQKGDRFSEQNIRPIRPGFGLPPKFMKSLVGTKARRDYRRGDPIR